jgi:hypothetical protein
MSNTASKWFSIATSNQTHAIEVERINDAIAEVIFNQDVAGLPVYLDINEEEVAAISAILGIDPSDFEKHLVEVVLKTPKSDSWKKVFKEFAWSAKKWAKHDNPMDVPPTLSLLAVLSKAAEVMASETDISGANYYRRLSSMFGCTGKETDLGGKYREHAVELWDSLRQWLGAWEGERGLSTVPIPKSSNPSGRDFKWAIQMPISQARLRDADRQDLHRMFEQRGLDPVSNISIEVMSIFLDNWVTSPYSTQNLKKIWRIEDYRDSLASAAISELRMWTGRSSGVGEFGFRLLLSANKSLRTGLRFGFNFEMRCNPTLTMRTVSIDMGGGVFQESEVFGVARGRFRLSDPGFFEPGSLISRPMKMRVKDTELVASRKVRQVIPMMQDEQHQFIEVDTLSMDGVFGILMVSEVPGITSSKFKEQWESILNEIARPGWSVITPDDEGVNGLPEGWIFVRDVEVMTVRTSKAPIYMALNALLPQAVPSLQFSRGLRIPGQQERWLVSHLPELKASYPSDESITIGIANSNSDAIKEFALNQRAGIVSLSELNLSEGRYFLEMKISDGSIVGRKMLTLVGASTPNAWAELKSNVLGYGIGQTNMPSAMSADEVIQLSSSNVVQGFRFTGVSQSTGVEMEPPSLAPWNEKFVIESAEEEIKRSQVTINTQDRASCFYTGRHKSIGPYWMGNTPPRGAVLRFRCEYCGVTTIQSAIPVYKWNRKPQVQKQEDSTSSLPHLDYKIIPPVPMKASGKWDLAFEAMCFMRNGKNADIQTIINQLVDDEDINIERFTHGAQLLGLIDLSLDESFVVKEWSVSPACVVMISKTKGFLSGYRSPDLVTKIESRIQDVGGHLEQFENKGLPNSLIFTLKNEEDVNAVFDGIIDPVSKQQISITSDIASIIAKEVGSISQLMESSPKIRIPSYIRLKHWDHGQTKWVDTEDPRSAGATQYVGYGNKYTYSDIAVDVDGYVTSGSVRTVKLKSAQKTKVPLVYYDSETKQFFARLGAELPGLYGRSLVAASGLAPLEDLTKRIVVYSGVEPQLARLIYGQLMS